MKKIVSVILLFFAAVLNIAAQDDVEVTKNKLDTIYNAVDSLAAADSTGILVGDVVKTRGLEARGLETKGFETKGESGKTKVQRDWDNWRPSPKRAMWLALVIPGAGQIYNRKFWKLPIIYGGIVGCIYAWSWNGQMYSDYSQAYSDLALGTGTSYEQIFRGRTIDESNKERYTTLCKSRKDRFRRWRDLSIFCLIGVYAISVIDAYVDAQLSEFDISEDLSLKVAPTYLNGTGNQMAANRMSSITNGGLGVRCQLRF